MNRRHTSPSPLNVVILSEGWRWCQPESKDPEHFLDHRGRPARSNIGIHLPVSSAEGAIYTSLGRSPRSKAIKEPEG